MNTTQADTPLSVSEMIQAMGGTRRQTALATNAIDQAQRTLAKLITQAQHLQTKLASADGDVVLNAAAYETGVAGYSNSLHTAAAELTAQLATIAAVVQAVI